MNFSPVPPPSAGLTALAELRDRAALTTVAGQTPAGRNRAIDAYRALAMVAVAVGHWLAADARMVDGKLETGNALDRLGSLHILTWLFQVMPIFFCIGGYSNAASLDAHRRKGDADSMWVKARLARLSAPAAWLAGTWLPIVLIGTVLGAGKLASQAAAVAAIPLWFLANYVVDTALAPLTLSAFRRHGRKFISALIALFAVGETARFLKVQYLPQVNIVVGWLLFQILGFAWKDRSNRMPSGWKLLAFGMSSWCVAGFLIAFGPWPLAMVSVPGAQFANTWPPSLALVFYGLGICSFAIAAAPWVSSLLTRRPALWRTVVGANTMTMTSYLWHFTALAVAAFVFSRLDLLPTGEVGTGRWWLAKVPLMICALIILTGLIRLLSPKERNGLLASVASTTGSSTAPGRWSTVALAVGLAGGFEVWTVSKGNPVWAVPGMASILLVNAALRRQTRYFGIAVRGVASVGQTEPVVGRPVDAKQFEAAHCIVHVGKRPGRNPPTHGVDTG